MRINKSIKGGFHSYFGSNQHKNNIRKTKLGRKIGRKWKTKAKSKAKARVAAKAAAKAL